jgi:Carboxypeptidase regulatory-like domain
MVHILRPPAFALFTVICLPPAGAMGSVKVAQPLHSSQCPRISVSLDGVPVNGARIEVFKDGQDMIKPVQSLLADSQGQAVLRKLPFDRYQVVASAKLNLVDGLVLDVDAAGCRLDDPSARFSMNLRPSPYPTGAQRLAAAEQAPIADTLQSFQGKVRDPTGAPIAGATLDIVRMHTGGRKHAAHLRTGADGGFAAKLRQGDYVVFADAQGFSTAVAPFTISKTGAPGKLSLTLKIGSMTE